MQPPLADAIIKGILLGLFMAVSVGPTLFAVIKYSLAYTYRAGLAFVLGVSLSDILYVTIANYAASWLRVLDNYRSGMALGGGAILVVAGIAGLVRRQKAPNAEVEILRITPGHYFKVWSSGFLINTINPGVVISWLTAVTATANTPGQYRFALFGTCLVLVLSIDFLKVFLAEKIRLRLTPGLVTMLHRLSSVILMVLGVLLMSGMLVNKQ
jgi:threonine/homoserine/homoserine lactone efflux protein